MNNFQLIGNLTNDVKLDKTKNGNDVSRFTLAVTAGKDNEGKPKTYFVDLVAWAQTANLLSKYGTKGKKLFVQGHIEPQEQAQKRIGSDGKEYKDVDMTLVVEQVEFLSSKKNEEKDNTKEK